jgi:GH15 family glucan-1,4-alpha-glucosidase
VRPTFGKVRLDDYALIGDCRSAALVSRAGSIDWLCWPRFDSPSLFARLLDPDGGDWSIAPVQPFRVERGWVPGTNVLETRFVTAGGEAVLTDLMPARSEAEKRAALHPEHELVRRVRCVRGEVELLVRYRPRPDYARRRPRLETTPYGLRCRVPVGILYLHGEIPLALRDDGAEARFVLRGGEQARFVLTLSRDAPAVLPRLDGVDDTIARSMDWWRGWIARLRHDGPFREAVERSALTLRLLVFAPSGAVVAAPTTSLPERPGGDLNWDYRYCWLRDASLTVRALFGVGFDEEAQAFVSWLLHATRLTRPELAVLYDVYGNRPPPEQVLPLAGFEHARPVRIGNAAVEQLQLDVYGEVVDAATQAWRRARPLDRDTRRMLRSLGEYLRTHWRLIDEGLWEPRSGRRAHTHSRLLSWVALDRLLQLHDHGQLPDLDAARLRGERQRIRREIEERAWNARLRSYVSTLDGESLDASLLLLAWYGFEDARSPRMRATFRAIREQLGAGGPLLHRYRGGESPGEGAFVVCGFWATEYLALGGGTLDEAERSLEAQLAFTNDVGLLAEEIDPRTGAPRGNFPQGFSHIGLINAAITVERRRAEERGTAPMEVRA